MIRDRQLWSLIDSFALRGGLSLGDDLPRIYAGQPGTGERFTFTNTAASTDGELLGFDLDLRPGGAVPIAHVHPNQSERFEVRWATGVG